MINLSWDTIRNIRDSFLKKTDWTQLTDVSLSEEDKKMWTDYRKNLRDITKNFRTPNEVVWPISPEIEKLNNE
jgi:hypothetical protein